MEAGFHFCSAAGTGLTYFLVIILCFTGVLLSCLSISGTWLVTAAAVIAALMRGFTFPGWWTIIIFLLLSVLVELAEALAGAWGVAKRGGSKFAGFMAVIGGLLGMIAGVFIPVPVFGSLLGMMIGSFLLVFWVEKRRLATSHAADIAMGAVIARVLVVLLKVVVTLAMCVFLFGELMVSC